MLVVMVPGWIFHCTPTDEAFHHRLTLLPTFIIAVDDRCQIMFFPVQVRSSALLIFQVVSLCSFPQWPELVTMIPLLQCNSINFVCRALSGAEWKTLSSMHKALVPRSSYIYEQIHLMESAYKLSHVISGNCFKVIQTQGEDTRQRISRKKADHKLVNCWHWIQVNTG